MANVKVYADELASGNSEKILSNNPITLTESKPLANMNGTDLVTKDNLTSIASPEYTIVVEAGDVNPLQVPANELQDNNIMKLRPYVFNTIPLYGDETTADTTEGATSRVDYFFTDSSKTVLDFILLWGVMGDPDEFGEDTTFTIS